MWILSHLWCLCLCCSLIFFSAPTQHTNKWSCRMLFYFIIGHVCSWGYGEFPTNAMPDRKCIKSGLRGNWGRLRQRGSRVWIYTSSLHTHCSVDRMHISGLKYTPGRHRLFWRGSQERNTPPSRPSVGMLALNRSIHHFLFTEVQNHASCLTPPHNHSLSAGQRVNHRLIPGPHFWYNQFLRATQFLFFTIRDWDWNFTAHFINYLGVILSKLMHESSWRPVLKFPFSPHSAWKTSWVYSWKLTSNHAHSSCMWADYYYYYYYGTFIVLYFVLT